MVEAGHHASASRADSRLLEQPRRRRHPHLTVELGDPAVAIIRATGVDTTSVGRERRARLGIDLARAFEHTRRYDKALATLLAAEKLAPDYVRPHPLVREIVGAQLRRTKPELRSLAKRIGVM